MGRRVRALQPAIIGADRMRRMIVTENENNIRLLLSSEGNEAGSEPEGNKDSHDRSKEVEIFSSC